MSVCARHLFYVFVVAYLAPSKQFLLWGEYSLIDIVHFEKWVVGLASSIVDVNSYFKQFSNVSDHVYHLYFHKFPLVYVVVYKFWKLGKTYLLFVVEPQTIVFVEYPAVQKLFIGQSLVMIFVVWEEPHNSKIFIVKASHQIVNLVKDIRVKLIFASEVPTHQHIHQNLANTETATLFCAIVSHIDALYGEQCAIVHTVGIFERTRLHWLFRPVPES